MSACTVLVETLVMILMYVGSDLVNCCTDIRLKFTTTQMSVNYVGAYSRTKLIFCQLVSCNTLHPYYSIIMFEAAVLHNFISLLCSLA